MKQDKRPIEKSDLDETGEFLEDVSVYCELLMDRGSEKLNIWKDLVDHQTAKSLLDDLGVPGETVTDQLTWIADRWLRVTSHTTNCVCMQCAAARKLKRLRLENKSK